MVASSPESSCWRPLSMRCRRDSGGSSATTSFQSWIRRAPLFNQQVRTPTELGSNISGDREHLAALIDGELGRNSGTGILRALHHQHADADSADNAVADGEILREGRSEEHTSE